MSDDQQLGKFLEDKLASQCDQRFFERDFEVGLELLSQGQIARAEGREAPTFEEVERQVDARRREERPLRREWRQDPA